MELKSIIDGGFLVASTPSAVSSNKSNQKPGYCEKCLAFLVTSLQANSQVPLSLHSTQQAAYERLRRPYYPCRLFLFDIPCKIKNSLFFMLFYVII